MTEAESIVPHPQRLREQDVKRLRGLHEWELAEACDDAAYILDRLFVTTMCWELAEKSKRLEESARRLRQLGCDREEGKPIPGWARGPVLRDGVGCDREQWTGKPVELGDDG